MKSKKKMAGIRKTVMSVIAAVVIAIGFGGALPAEAANTGSVTLTKWPVNGTSFSLYKIADVNGTDYTASSSIYASLIDNTDISSLKNEEMEKLADELNAAIEKNAVQADASVVYGQGDNEFHDLATGLYLLKGQETRSGYTTYTPQVSLISIPDWKSGSLQYDQKIEPKYKKTTVTPPTKPTAAPKPVKKTTKTTKSGKVIKPTLLKQANPVKTGDYTQLGLYIGILLVAAAIIVLIFVKRKNKTEDSE